MDFEYITTAEQLANLCGRIDAVDWVALDTEFMREKTYVPQLCLLQLATPDWAVCVDPLAEFDLEPLLDSLFRSSLLKVLHAASQDLEIFFCLRGSVPAPLFDTQVAAPLLGYQEQIGYGNLVSEVLGVKLNKAHSRADWSHRPLDEAQLRYAADDVIYLAQVYPRMRDQLTEKGRLVWLEGEFAALAEPGRYRVDPDEAWLRVKAVDRQRGATLAVVQALARWREQTAREENRPRGWLFKDDVLLDLARMQPDSKAALGRMRGLHDRVAGRHGETLLNLIKSARKDRPQPLPPSKRFDKPSPLQDAIVDVLMAVVRIRAAENSLNPGVLASRKQLVALVMGDRDTALSKGWRGDVIGGELERILSGALELRVEQGALHILPGAGA